MDTDTFDRLTRRFGRPGTRRAALGLLLGTAVLGTSLGTTAAKPEPVGYGKFRGKSARRGKRRGQRRGRVSAQAKTKPGNHCIAPDGLDLNEYFGVSAQIVTGFCPEVGSGEEWIAPSIWFVNDTFAVVPEGFVPGGPTPVEDFRAKFTALKLVIDPGTRQQRTVVLPHDGNLFTGPAAGDFPGIPADWFVVTPVTLGTAQPLSVGDHVVEVFWIFSAMHCDGVGADPSVFCFPAGETRYQRYELEVVPGHH